ncbi:unnamed protein product [Timema podura]|uniref:Uncharacterized protein n=1 Tax=Timema podura TaxID=61482 RepID=A0ABN7P405_TIMPD|nr:unnamed protein product [Timema podura]
MPVEAVVWLEKLKKGEYEQMSEALFLWFDQLIGMESPALAASGFTNAISQMPVVLIPVHFDRDQVMRISSCQRSVVLRPFCTHDFMTGVPAVPGQDLPIDVSINRVKG